MFWVTEREDTPGRAADAAVRTGLTRSRRGGGESICVLSFRGRVLPCATAGRPRAPSPRRNGGARPFTGARRGCTKGQMDGGGALPLEYGPSRRTHAAALPPGLHSCGAHAHRSHGVG